MSWDRGYYSEGSYTSHFYRELAPGWIDFSLLVKGQQPPRSKDGAPFSYLEMGCGMGLSLCLLAATHPEGEFVGIDFLPDHVAHANGLASELGLSNLRVLEADFINLQQDGSPLGLSAGHSGHFHYVTAHGIASWVVEPVQQALLAVAAAALKPGGAFYCSYNTYPGWLGLTAFRQLSELERERHDPCSPELAYRAAATTLAALLGQGKETTALGQMLPKLHDELARLPWHEPNYLTQEYASQGWAPLFVADMHRRCRKHKLRFRASATLPELFDEFLIAGLRPSVLQETNPDIRQTLLDLATNKSFRRDLFVYGDVPLTPQRRNAALSELPVRLQETPPLDHYRFPTSFGDIAGNDEAYRSLEAALVEGPLSLAQLQEATGLPEQELLPMVALLLHRQRLGLDRGEAAHEASETCRKANNTLLRRIREGEAINHLAAPAIGSAISFSPLEALTLEAQTGGLTPTNAAACVLLELSASGKELLSEEGNLLKDPEEQQRRIEEIGFNLVHQRLPQLRSLDVFSSM
ncbi:methyltransferase regulatory domain-containing protein [Cyanobium sp. AMD-g]|uniref:class I SAM-dependent methyltransferase n=1 Tax=Cyanobium sp. AMD-g TaxID=2823699 RepID=UPI0020CE7241|nr:class I SAM-dependent methyltransferase [Cyanobium sp. AMD-g]MCP9931478.1 methyltransferase regulatory domain-containing protein [Cyanobium sp. AMD-g]